MTIYLHQILALSPYLFALVMDELTKNIPDDVSWCMLFADNIVIINETRKVINFKLNRWRNFRT